MIRKRGKGTESHEVRVLDRLDDIRRELKRMNGYLDDQIENRKTERAELSFLFSLVGVGISVSSLLVKALSGDSRILLFGGGISLIFVIAITSYLMRLVKDRPIPREIMATLGILLLVSAYSIALGLGAL